MCKAWNLSSKVSWIICNNDIWLYPKRIIYNIDVTNGSSRAMYPSSLTDVFKLTSHNWRRLSLTANGITGKLANQFRWSLKHLPDKQLFTWQTALHLTMTSTQVFATPYNDNNSSLFWNYFYLFLTGRSHHTVDFYSEGKYSLHSLIHSFILPVEPKPADSTHRAKPVLSYIGNPEPSVFNCEFSGYPPPDVRILKDGQVLAYGEDSLSYSVSVDSVDDFGEYICMAENEVGKSKKNYTFEIRSSGNEYGKAI